MRTHADIHKRTHARTQTCTHLTQTYTHLTPHPPPPPVHSITVEEIWEHDWVAADPEAEAAAAAAALPSAEALAQHPPAPLAIQEVDEPTSPPRPPTTRMNAFQLLGASLDVSALFDPGTGAARRGTARFSCGRNLRAVLDRLADLVRSVGGSVDRDARPGCVPAGRAHGQGVCFCGHSLRTSSCGGG